MVICGDDPEQLRCDICNNSRALTATAQLYTLAVRGPKHTYVKRICEECVPLFNTTHWPKLRKLLRTLRPTRYGITHRKGA
ncbi:hypothetical protein SEA_PHRAPPUCCINO_30 [Mycobacterium phage Phrappuccino]|uniref:Uncharacterized protein n=1 Tax=Mycobacterium phage Phrappuccino TaxID=2591223 RepID=A0A514DDM5_9CAUD|nr:hypothetical protein KHQ87_gp030 [Mycobacterium phage Phrappuccino]QDH91708.1 hypothetical protein SEA_PHRAPPUCCINO_30 [Mycobacterium phage Phrappuccino]QIQ63152.1 hypothetical protein SEA_SETTECANDELA_30 [Mycobacterium phage Settecandela]